MRRKMLRPRDPRHANFAVQPGTAEAGFFLLGYWRCLAEVYSNNPLELSSQLLAAPVVSWPLRQGWVSLDEKVLYAIDQASGTIDRNL